MGIKNNLILLKEYMKIALASAMEYRFNFVLQSITMMLNDAIWILFWWIFFSRFNVVNGWQLKELLMLYAVVTFSYGFSGFLFGNRHNIANIIAEGKLDFYLGLPKSELFHLLISRSSAFSFGDAIFGLVLGIISFSIWQWPLFLLLITIAAVISISFAVIVGSLAFYWGNAEETARTLNFGMLSFAIYPLPIFKGFVRVLILTIIPAGFIGGIPVELLKNFSWQWLGLSILVAIIFFTVAIYVFRKGLKKYESGNLINVRV
jgi:ABC-2 type transport system permease protein